MLRRPRASAAVRFWLRWHHERVQICSLFPRAPLAELVERVQAALAGRYTIERELGRGGMAVVFLAHDPKHDRRVALKVLNPELALAIGAERFLREITIAAKLAHPHILPLYDSGEADRLLFYVMPFVQGGSLRDRLNQEKQLPIEDAIRLAGEVAGALDRAHREGVVHRDIKPENILLEGGYAIVADFGIARAMSAAGGQSTTRTGMAVGTPTYMSPEQAAGARDLDQRSDQYSLACVVYEMLAGHPPFQGDSVQELLARHAMDPVPSIRAARHSVPEHVEGAVAKALAKECADRFSTVLAFAQALTAPRAPSSSGSPVPRTEEGLWGRVRAVFSKPAPRVRSPKSIPSPVSVATPSVTTPPERRAIDSLAVLPFGNMSRDPDSEYLSDGITESIINKLSRLSSLRVVPRSVVFRYKGREIDPSVVANEVNARAVVTGRILQRGDTLIIKAELVDAATESQLWGEQYNRRLSDIFAVQEEMAAEITRSLRVQLTGEEEQGLAKRYTENTDAYQAFLKGRYYWNKRTEEGLRQSVEHLKRALSYDPRFALALAGLADSYVTLGIYGAARPREVMPLAKAAAEHALAIDERLAEALVPRGCVRSLFDWDWPGGENDFTRAIEVNPRHPTAHHWYAVNCLAPQGRFPEAWEELRRAQELDPVSPAINASAGLLFYLERRYDRAVEECRTALEPEPNFGLIHYFLGLAYAALARHEEAVGALREAVRLTGESPEPVSALAYAYARAGRPAEAQDLISQLQQRSAQRYVSPVLLALPYIGLGAVDLAFEWLDKGREVRSADLAWLGVRPVFDDLRADPRFDALRRSVHLPASAPV